jgi:hypothetical protein
MSLSERIYKTIIQLYPQNYLDEFQEPMLQNFRDIEREHKSIFPLWLLISFDTINSLITQYMQISFELTKSKNKLALITLIFVLPFFVFLGLAFVFQIFHVESATLWLNTIVDHHVNWFGLFIGVFPFAAIALNLIAIIYHWFADRPFKSATIGFVKNNFPKFCSSSTCGFDSIVCSRTRRDSLYRTTSYERWVA